MPRSKVVTLAGQDYLVEQRNMQSNKVWRDNLTGPVDKIVALIQNYDTLEISSVGDIAGLILIVKDVLFDSMDLLLDSLFNYSPVLAADRDRIEAEAYDDEAIEALGIVVGLAYPLDRLLSVWIGPAATPTSTNSLSRNGASGKKNLATQKNTGKT